MTPLDLVMLTPLISRTGGRTEVKIGLIDGPVSLDHPELARANVYAIRGNRSVACTQETSAACFHGTFVAGILCARRGSVAPAICPNCTLLVRPIFAEARTAKAEMPVTTVEELAEAIVDCIAADAQVLNISAALAQPSTKNDRVLADALDQAAKRGVLVIVAAGNQGIVGSTTITRHPGVIPVVAYNYQRRPMDYSNLGSSIGRRGLGAPGESITSLRAHGDTLTLAGTSAAAPFVTGTVALLWSLFPKATVAQIKLAITQPYARRRPTVVPPLLNAWDAFQDLLVTFTEGTSV